MRIIKPLAFLALASLTFVACDAKDTLLRARDGAADLGAGGAGTGGSGGHFGTGGGAGPGGSGGTPVTATGGGTSVGGSAGAGTGGSGPGGAAGNRGMGGTAKDAGLADSASDVAMSTDAPASDDGGVNCGPGYPVGSQKPMGDGCNTCYCQSSGSFLCTTKACPVPDAAPEVGVDAGQCPAGQIYCPGCTPGTGTCGVVCTGAPCPCTGSSCPMADASTTKDGANAESGAATCSQVTTQAECDVRSDCHSLYRSLGACGCALAGCCMRFDRCADGALATCTPPTSIGCTIATPGCDSPYVLSYTPGCYEGCVKTTECTP